MSQTIKFVRTRPPASLQMRAMMLSRAHPRRPNIPASAHAAQWWPQGSSGRPHRQLRAERGRTWRRRRSTTTRNKWDGMVVSLLVGVTVKAAPAPGPDWDLINVWIWAEVRENNSSRNSPSTRMLASCCHPRCVPGSLSSGTRSADAVVAFADHGQTICPTCPTGRCTPPGCAPQPKAVAVSITSCDWSGSICMQAQKHLHKPASCLRQKSSAASKCNLLAQTRNVPATTMKTADQRPSETCPATSGAPWTFSPSALTRMQGGPKVSQAPSCPAVRWARLIHATPTLSLRDLLLSPCGPELRTQLVVLWRCSTLWSSLGGCGSLLWSAMHSGGGCTQCLSSPARLPRRLVLSICESRS